MRQRGGGGRGLDESCEGGNVADSKPRARGLPTHALPDPCLAHNLMGQMDLATCHPPCGRARSPTHSLN